MLNSTSILGYGNVAMGGGFDPVVVDITNLNDSGAGSWRAFMEDDGNWGPRINRNLVSGRVKLRSEVRVAGDVTYVASTAAESIEHTDYRLRITEDNVILSGIIGMVGTDANVADGDDLDGISIGFQPNVVQSVVIINSMVLWSSDEALSSWGPNKNTTFQYCIIAEALRDNLHSKGAHGFGTVAGSRSEDGTQSRLSIIHCLYAHNDLRNPVVKDGIRNVEMIGNIIYNYGNAGMTFNGTAQVNVINNVFITGPSSSNVNRALLNSTNNNDLYLSGNKRKVGNTYTDILPDNMSGVNTSTPRFTPYTTTYPAAGQATYDHVLANVGPYASHPHRLRLIEHVKNGYGVMINHPGEALDEVGEPFNKLRANGSRPTDAEAEAIAYAYQFPGAGPIQQPDPEPVVFETGNGTGGVWVLIDGLGLDPTKTYKIEQQSENALGAGPKSAPPVIASPLSAAGGTSPVIIGSNAASNWNWTTHPAASFEGTEAAGDYFIGMFSTVASDPPSSNSFATFLSPLSLVVNKAATGGNDETLQGIGYKVASGANEAALAFSDAGGVSTSNIATSVWATITNAGGVPSALGATTTGIGTNLAHSGGTVSIGDMVVVCVSASISGRISDNQIPTLSCAGLPDLTLVRHRATTTNLNMHSYMFAGTASQANIGTITGAASNAMNWTVSAIRVPS